MDALTVMTAPVTTSAAKSGGGLGPEVGDPQQGQSFGQVLAQQGAATPAEDSAGADATSHDSESSGDREPVAPEQAAAAKQPAEEAEAQPAKDSAVTAAAAGSDEAGDDAGRLAAAAALMQWLSVMPQSVVYEQGQPDAPTTGPTIQAVAPNPVAAEASADVASVLGGAAAMQTAPATDLQDGDTGAQQQFPSAPAVELQAAPVPSGAVFQNLLGQLPGATQASQLITVPLELPRAALEIPVGNHAWADELGTRLAVMTARGEQTGSLKLNPEHLGPLEVQIRVQDDNKASVVFGAQHADTRAALHDALPRLREMFAASGLQLTDAGVSRDGARQALPTRLQRSLSSGGLDESGGIEAVPVQAALRHAGMIDAIA